MLSKQSSSLSNSLDQVKRSKLTKLLSVVQVGDLITRNDIKVVLGELSGRTEQALNYFLKNGYLKATTVLICSCENRIEADSDFQEHCETCGELLISIENRFEGFLLARRIDLFLSPEIPNVKDPGMITARIIRADNGIVYDRIGIYLAEGSCQIVGSGLDIKPGDIVETTENAVLKFIIRDVSFFPESKIHKSCYYALIAEVPVKSNSSNINNFYSTVSNSAIAGGVGSVASVHNGMDQDILLQGLLDLFKNERVDVKASIEEAVQEFKASEGNKRSLWNAYGSLVSKVKEHVELLPLAMPYIVELQKYLQNL